MTTAKRVKLYNLIQFVDMSYRDKDINEQYRDYKSEQIKMPGCAATQDGQRKI